MQLQEDRFSSKWWWKWQPAMHNY